MLQFQARMVREHGTAQGANLPRAVVRAATILLLNNIAQGYSAVGTGTLAVIEAFVNDAKRIGATVLPMHDSTSMGDVSLLAHLVRAIFESDASAPRLQIGEALPLIAQSSVSTAMAALAVNAASELQQQLLVLAALDVEAFAAETSPYQPLLGEVRGHAGYTRVLHTLWPLLEGGAAACEPARHLQSPLSFRTVASVLGAGEDAMGYVRTIITRELNAHQQNPLYLASQRRVVPNGHFDTQAVSTALDLARLALAPCLTAQCERSVKLLQAHFTGLTDGLAPFDDDHASGHGLSEVTWPLQALAAEARLLVQPVSAEVASASQAEGIEDRVTLCYLSARRLLLMVALMRRVIAIGAVIACQAIDLRAGGPQRLSVPLRAAHDAVRAIVPPMFKGGSAPPAVQCMHALVDALNNGADARSAEANVKQQEGEEEAVKGRPLFVDCVAPLALEEVEAAPRAQRCVAQVRARL